MTLSRRKFLRDFSLGTSGVLLGVHRSGESAYSLKKVELQPSRVSFVTGEDRRQNMLDVLKPFEADVKSSILGKQIILKPNGVQHTHPLCSTHVDALRGVLDFLTQFTESKIIIAESSASKEGTLYTFESHGYFALTEEYNVELVDLDEGKWIGQEILATTSGDKATVKLNQPFLDPDNYLISVAPPKTHNCVVATLTVKNILMAAPLNKHGSKKATMHGKDDLDYEVITNNMFLVANKIFPHLAIIDGVTGMENDGPVEGTAVEHGMALAGTDAIAVDRICVKLMGIDPDHLLYLRWCANGGLGQYDMKQIERIGKGLDDHIIPYRMHEVFEQQIEWIGKNPPTPSPFLGVEGTEVHFSLPVPDEMVLHVWDLKGRPVRKLVSGAREAGRYSITWDGRDDFGSRLAHGFYFIALHSGTRTVWDPSPIRL